MASLGTGPASHTSAWRGNEQQQHSTTALLLARQEGDVCAGLVSSSHPLSEPPVSWFKVLQDQLHLQCWARDIGWPKVLRCSSDIRPSQWILLERNCSHLQVPAQIQTSSGWLSFELNCCLVISVYCANDSQTGYGWTCVVWEPQTGLSPLSEQSHQGVSWHWL